MMILASELLNKRVMSRDGRHLGEVTELELDPTQWTIGRLAVRLRRDALGDLELRKPLIGARTVWLPTGLVESVTDVIVLRQPIGGLTFGESDLRDESDAASP